MARAYAMLGTDQTPVSVSLATTTRRGFRRDSSSGDHTSAILRETPFDSRKGSSSGARGKGVNDGGLDDGWLLTPVWARTGQGDMDEQAGGTGVALMGLVFVPWPKDE